MIKFFGKTAVAIAVAVFVLAAVSCEQPTAETKGPDKIDSGTYSPELPNFNATSFATLGNHSASWWNQRGHQHNFPDLFTFADQSKVTNISDWERRRAEISRIVQYYEYGIMPSIATADVTVTWADSQTATGFSTAFTFRHNSSGRSFNYTQAVTVPSELLMPANKGKLPLYLGNGGSPTAGMGAGQFQGGSGDFGATQFASETNGSGAVATLFGLDYTKPDSPSANMSYAWGMSMILTALEDTTNPPFGGYFNSKQVSTTGYSRNGKAAECIAAFAQGRGGSRIASVAIGSAGSGGPSLERFLSPSGYNINGEPADPLPPTGQGLMKFEGLIGKSWYMRRVQAADVPYTFATPGGTNDNVRYTAVRGWAPYYEAYETTPADGSNDATNTNNKTPFVGWQTPTNAYSGIQSLSEGRAEVPGWFSVRFREFADLHYGLDIDHVWNEPKRGKHGILCTMPLDQHFTSALIPPMGVLFQDGYIVPRNNPESQMANAVILDEIYKMYGEAENDEYRYVWRNGATMIWGSHGGNTGNEGPDKATFAMMIWEDIVGGKGKAAYPDGNNGGGSAHMAKIRDWAFPVDDPVGRFDYYRMNWGRPGHPTIADRVKKMVDPILPDYRASLATWPQPTVGAAPVQKPTGYNPQNKGFKAMDWRGLLDNPEPLN